MVHAARNNSKAEPGAKVSQRLTLHELGPLSGVTIVEELRMPLACSAFVVRCSCVWNCSKHGKLHSAKLQCLHQVQQVSTCLRIACPSARKPAARLHTHTRSTLHPWFPPGWTGKWLPGAKRAPLRQRVLAGNALCTGARHWTTAAAPQAQGTTGSRRTCGGDSPPASAGAAGTGAAVLQTARHGIFFQQVKLQRPCPFAPHALLEASVRTLEDLVHELRDSTTAPATCCLFAERRGCAVTWSTLGSRGV